MAYTTITAATIGLADGDTSPQPLDGTVRITPRFPSAATTGGFTVSGPVVVSVTGGDMPQIQIPAMAEATGSVEFHLYDRNAGPVKMPATEIPLEPGTTISLHDYLPAAVDPATGWGIAKGERGFGVTEITASDGVVTVAWEGGDDVQIPIPTAALATPASDGLMASTDKSKLDGINLDFMRDTGWRDVTGSVLNYRTGRLAIRRVGRVVEIVAEGLGLSGSPGTFDFANPPTAGFNPSRPVYLKTVKYWAAESSFTIRVWTDMKIRGQFESAVDPQFTFQVVFTTTDAWPATLPGTPQ